MKTKINLTTLVIVLSIVSLMTGAAMALEQKQLPISYLDPCPVSVAVAGFCIESMNPVKGYVFPSEGGTGTITVYYPKLTAISATSDSSSVTITGFKVLDANHLLVSYKVAPNNGYCSSYVQPGSSWDPWTIGTIKIKAKGYRNVVISQSCNYNP